MLCNVMKQDLDLGLNLYLNFKPKLSLIWTKHSIARLGHGPDRWLNGLDDFVLKETDLDYKNWLGYRYKTKREEK